MLPVDGEEDESCIPTDPFDNYFKFDDEDFNVRTFKIRYTSVKSKDHCVYNYTCSLRTCNEVVFAQLET